MGLPHSLVAIDPGEKKSAVLILDLKALKIERGMVSAIEGPNIAIFAKVLDNRDIRRRLREGLFHEGLLTTMEACLVIEDMDGYGQPIGGEVMRTLKWIGRFDEAWNNVPAGLDPTEEITRREVKLHLCNDSRATDSNVHAAVWDRFGGSRRAAVGVKKKPGPCFGFHSHLWAALAVAITWIERRA